jgi:aryl-alcohol dehydrogenase-like predicted oxidoreductase
MTVEGFATSEGTARYRDRFEVARDEHHFRFEQNLWLSSIGTGTYLGEADEESDRLYSRAVARAVELGANVIDTAANYRFQRSERAIGDALEALTGAGAFARDELVVCTKGGYLPFDGGPPGDVRAYVEETFVRPGVADFSDFVGGSHCMTPRYLAHQLAQSLGNMRLACVDVYYIHNPESQAGALPAEEFDARLRAAFARLEEERAAGRLRNYGVATWNGFRVTEGERGYHSLERMVALAREAGGDEHGFRFIQLPFNLGMPEALTLANQKVAGERVTVLEAARELQVTVVASASLFQGRVARGLPDEVREPLGSLSSDAQTAIQFVRSAPGITTALVGMGRPAHVEENLQLARVAPTSPADFRRLFAEEGE